MKERTVVILKILHSKPIIYMSFGDLTLMGVDVACLVEPSEEYTYSNNQ